MKVFMKTFFKNKKADAIEHEVEITPEEAKAISHYEHPKTMIENLFSDAEMVLFEPRNTDELRTIVAYLKKAKACVVDFHRLPQSELESALLFLRGSVYVLDGKVQKVDYYHYLLLPKKGNEEH